MKVNKEYVENLFSDIIDKNIFIKGIFSNPLDKEYPYSKINIKPLKIKKLFMKMYVLILQK